jgi:hypothetical protein
MPEHNYRAIKLITDRYSAHISAFNYLDVSEEDSDRQYFLYKDLEILARAAFARAPEVKLSGNRMALLPSADLGNAYKTLRAYLTPDERIRYNAIHEDLVTLSDKYEG